ncbi:hypothetical protein MHYP_G00108790 [Metynnis hypsauchen]
MNWDSDVEEEISEMEDPSEPDNNAIDDPDCQFSHDEEDSEDDSAGVPSSDENQETQQLSSTEGTWTSKDACQPKQRARKDNGERSSKRMAGGTREKAEDDT